MGRSDGNLSSLSRRPRLRRGELRQCRHAGSTRARVAQSGLRRGRRPLVEATGRVSEVARLQSLLFGSRSRGGVGLERRRQQHVESPIPIAGAVQGRRGGRARSRSAALRHDLYGTLHGPAGHERRRIKAGTGDQLRRRAERRPADRARFRRRQRPLSRFSTPGEPADRAREAVRLHDLSGSHPCDRGGTGNVAAPFPPADALSDNAPVGWAARTVVQGRDPVTFRVKAVVCRSPPLRAERPQGWQRRGRRRRFGTVSLRCMLWSMLCRTALVAAAFLTSVSTSSAQAVGTLGAGGQPPPERLVESLTAALKELPAIDQGVALGTWVQSHNGFQVEPFSAASGAAAPGAWCARATRHEDLDWGGVIEHAAVFYPPAPASDLELPRQASIDLRNECVLGHISVEVREKNAENADRVAELLRQAVSGEVGAG